MIEQDQKQAQQEAEIEDLKQALRVLRRIIAARDHRQKIQVRYYRQAERLLKRRGYLIEAPGGRDDAGYF